MCGLAGIFDTRTDAPIDQRLVTRMIDVQVHRGPDASGVHFGGGIGLGHRRLSIIDVSNGQQPMYTHDSKIVVVYNGEIYNYQEVRAQLIKRGYVFETNSDTEVILYAWREWQEQCVTRFRGMFVFALFDESTKTLFLARDRIGIKPLYYTQLSNGHLLFASEAKGLLVHPGVSRELNLRSVDDYFAYGYIPDPNTAFDGVNRLPAGSTLKVTRGSPMPQPKTYWDVLFQDNGLHNEDEIASELVDRLREAVRIRLISEVPLGAFLSGGIDSSAVVAMMAGISNTPINTCSISFGDPTFNESSYAARVAEQYKTNHVVEEVDPGDIGLVDRLTDFYDEPFADASAIPTYRLCGLARQRVTVSLSGDGGDENLAGYRRHLMHMNEEKVRGMLPGAIRGPLFGFLGNIYPKADWAPRIFRAKYTLQALGMDSVEAYFHSVSVFSDQQRHELFSERLKRGLGGYKAIQALRNILKSAPTDDPLSLIQYLDIKCYLPGDILTKVDRASMAHSLEVRVPILDHEFVQWLAGLPSKLKLNGTKGKYIFKKALDQHLAVCRTLGRKTM